MPDDKIITLADIDKNKLPFLVVCHDFKSLFGVSVNMHTHGIYSHCMWCWRYDEKLKDFMMATQGWTFGEVPLSKYVENYMLKFWYNPEWTAEQKATINNIIYARLSLPFWLKAYDIIGIIGQKFNMDWLNIPCLDYCSESAGYRILSKVEPTFTNKHADPSEVNAWCIANEKMKVYLRYIPDDFVDFVQG